MNKKYYLTQIIANPTQIFADYIRDYLRAICDHLRSTLVFRKPSLIRLVSIVTILSFVFSNAAFALPASPSGGPDTLRPKQPLQQRPEVVQGLGVELLQGAGKTQPPAQGGSGDKASRGADRGYITIAEHEKLQAWLEKVEARSENNRRRDLEEKLEVKGKIEIYLVPDMFKKKDLRGHYAIRDGIVYIDKGTFKDENGMDYLRHEVDELSGILEFCKEKFGGDSRKDRSNLVKWLDKEGNRSEVGRLLRGIHNEAHILPDSLEHEIPYDGVVDTTKLEGQIQKAGEEVAIGSLLSPFGALGAVTRAKQIERRFESTRPVRGTAGAKVKPSALDILGKHVSDPTSIREEFREAAAYLLSDQEMKLLEPEVTVESRGSLRILVKTRELFKEILISISEGKAGKFLVRTTTPDSHDDADNLTNSQEILARVQRDLANLKRYSKYWREAVAGPYQKANFPNLKTTLPYIPQDLRETVHTILSDADLALLNPSATYQDIDVGEVITITIAHPDEPKLTTEFKIGINTAGKMFFKEPISYTFEVVRLDKIVYTSPKIETTEELSKIARNRLRIEKEKSYYFPYWLKLARERASREAEYFVGGQKVDWDVWEVVLGNPNQIRQKENPTIVSQRGSDGKFSIFGGGKAAGEGEPKLSIPDQMRLAEGATEFADALRGDVLPQTSAPDIKGMVDEAIKQADEAAQAAKSAPEAPAKGAITLSSADDEPQLFVGSTGDEEFEPFHSAVFKAQEIYEQGGKTQEAARKASEALISYLIKMHNMDYPVNLDYAIFILKNAGNPDLLPIAAVLEEFQAGPKDDAGELLANLKAAIIDSLQEELRGLREQELTLSRTDEVVLRIPTYLRREELAKIEQRREQINAQIKRLTAASFLKAIDNWQMSEEWPGISVKDKGVQTYVVNLPYDYSEPEVLLTSLRAELGAGVNIVVRLRGADEKTFSYYRKFNLGLDLKLGIEAIEQVDENMLSQALRGIEVKPGEKHLFIIEKENYSGLKSEEAILSNMQQVNANLKVALVQKTDLAQPTDASRRILNLLFGPKQVDVITPETITGEDLRQELTTALAALRKA